MVNLGIVDEGASQKVANGLGGQLRVALVHCQLPSRTTATHCRDRRRRIYKEEKAKVVAAAWKTKSLQFLSIQTIFAPARFEKKDEIILIFNHPGAKKLV